MKIKILGWTIVTTIDNNDFIIDDTDHCIPSEKMIRNVLSKIDRPKFNQYCPFCHTELPTLERHWSNKITMIKQFRDECNKISGHYTELRLCKETVEKHYL